MKSLDSKQVVKVLGALAQDSRLAIFRMLVERGAQGCSVGEIGAQLGLPSATLSFHLKELSFSGLIHSRQAGRFVYYAPDFEIVNGLMQFLTENCCSGTDCGVDGAICASAAKEKTAAGRKAAAPAAKRRTPATAKRTASSRRRAASA